MKWLDKFEHTIFDDGNIICIRADCLDVMKEMEDESVDLVLTDPPFFDGPNRPKYYGAEKSTKGIKRKEYKQPKSWELPTIKHYKHFCRISKHQIIFGINYFEFSNRVSGRIIWDKMNDNSTFSNGEIASYSKPTGLGKIYRYLWNGMLQQDMKNKEKKIHPTQKPAGLIGRILEDTSNIGGLIFDGYSGSFSTAVACVRAKRRCIAIEIDEEYYRMGCERVRGELKQPFLL